MPRLVARSWPFGRRGGCAEAGERRVVKALVTGGGGFLGGAIVRLLRERGDEVRSFARGAYPALEEAGVEVHRGDLADAAAVSRAVEGMDVVIHVGALPGVWGPYEDYHRANVTGTEHVLAACTALARL